MRMLYVEDLENYRHRKIKEVATKKVPIVAILGRRCGLCACQTCISGEMKTDTPTQHQRQIQSNGSVSWECILGLRPNPELS
jgi:hypothetical protein